MTILDTLVLFVIAGLTTLTVVVLAEVGSLLAHMLAKRYRQPTVTARSGSRHAPQTR